MRISNWTVFTVVALTACAEPPATSSESDDLARVVHHIPPHGTSTVSLRTLPDATCSVHAPGAPQPAIRAYSDDDGIARLELAHLDTSVASGSLAVDCSDDTGSAQSTTIDVVVDAHAKPEAPAPFDHRGKPTLDRSTPLPPHAPGDPLIAQLVASAPTVIAPHVVAEPALSHSVTTTSGNWSGYVLTSPRSAPIYAYVYGEWNTPRVYPEGSFYSSDHSSFWVGIDGFGSNDVVQDGTDSNTLTLFWIGTTSYDAWVEWYPLTAQTVSNFPVNPGDHVRAWTWVTDASGNYSPNPTLAHYYMWNQTQNVYVLYTLTAPQGITLSGHSAEWVLERPTVGGSVSSLANYSTAQMSNAIAYDLSGATHQYGGDSSDTSWNVTMNNNGHVLSTVAPVNSSTMQFTWRAYQ